MRKKGWLITCLLLCAGVLVLTAAWRISHWRSTEQVHSPVETLSILKAEAVGERLIKLTLNRRLSGFSPDDLRVAASERTWDAMDHRLGRTIEVRYADDSLNNELHSVIWLEVGEKMDHRGRLVDVPRSGKLPLLTNEVYYVYDLNVDMVRADKLLTWQTASGGWDKELHVRPDPKDANRIISERSWDGKESRSMIRTVDGEEAGSLDHGATVNEMVLIAKMYRETYDRRYRASLRKAVDWLLEMQYESGGWPKAYPRTGTDQDLITFQNDAMVRAMTVLLMIRRGEYPFDAPIVDEDQLKRIDETLDRGFAFIASSQLVKEGIRTGWAAHYDPATSEAIREEVAIPETAGIVRLLMMADLPELDGTLQDAVAYLRKLEPEDQETRQKIEALIQVYDSIGYYVDHLYVEVVGDGSQDEHGRSWIAGEVVKVAPADPSGWEGPPTHTAIPEYIMEEDQRISPDELEAEHLIIVAADGSGDYTSVQAAVDAVPENNRQPVTIYIKSGLYYERVIIPKSKPHITFVGESKLDTIITYLDITGTGFNGNTVIIEADDFTARNMTFANEAGAIGTASAVEVRGDRGVFEHVRFIGYQDTLYLNSRGGRFYFRNCTVQGAVDFIYGPAIAYFDRCTLFLTRSGGYITAASTPQDQEVGLVFSNCRIVGYPWVENVYFGRPWREYANDVFLHTWIDEGKIHLAGWHNWGSPDKEKTARYMEYGSYGPGANIRYRAKWTKQLSREEAVRYTPEYVLGGQDGWAPYK